jgi:hypothetical protein
MLMEILFGVKRDKKPCNEICTQNNEVIKDLIKGQYSRYAGEVDNLYSSSIRLHVAFGAPGLPEFKCDYENKKSQI